MSCTFDHPHDDCPDVTHKYQALESERDSLRRELELLGVYKAVTGKMEIDRDSWRAKALAYEKALNKCVVWIEAVMDGFSIPKNAQSRSEVLGAAKSALGAEGGV